MLEPALGTPPRNKFFVEFHFRMFISQVEPLLVTMLSIFCVAAHFKEGGYRAFKAFASQAETCTFSVCHVSDNQLDLACRQMVRIVRIAVRT